jgi:hypothetical protein
MRDPKAVMKVLDLEVPDVINVKVMENADDCVHITLSAEANGSMDLPDTDPSNAAGGAITLGGDRLCIFD